MWSVAMAAVSFLAVSRFYVHISRGMVLANYLI